MASTYVFTGVAGSLDWNAELDMLDDHGNITNQRFNWTIYSNINDPSTGVALDGLYPNDPLPTTSTDVQIGPAGGSQSYQVTLSEADHYGKKAFVGNLAIAAGSSLTLQGVSEGAGASNIYTVLTVNGNIYNAGGITLNTAAYHGSGIVLQKNTTLSGGGGVVFANIGFYSNAGFFNASGFSTTLTNVDNTISGVGQISNLSDVGGGSGAGVLTFVNHGVVNANGSRQMLLDSGSSTAATVNTGTFEATGTGGLLIQTPILDNRGGTILAADGADVVLRATHLEGGTLSTGGAGRIVLDGGGNILDSSLTSGKITNSGTITQNQASSTTIKGGLINNGTINVNGAAHAGSLLLLDGDNALSGAGTVHLQADVYDPRSITNVAGQTITFTNSGNVIDGFGSIGSNSSGALAFVNKGSVVANSSNQLTINASTVVNTGAVSSRAPTGGGTSGGLAIQTPSFDNRGGTVSAGDGTNVTIISTRLIGGSLSSGGLGQIVLSGAGNILDGTQTNGKITNTGTLVQNIGGSTSVKGGLTNNGTILQHAQAHSGSTIVIDGALVLDGTGAVKLETDVYGPLSITNLGAQSATFTNMGNTIDGAGAIGGSGGGRLAFSNAGRVLADSTEQLILNHGTVANTGVIAASGSAGLSLSDVAVITSGGGTVVARAGSHVDFAASTLSGNLTTEGDGYFQATDSASTLDGAVLRGTLKLADRNMKIKNGFDSAGTIAISGAAYSGGYLMVDGSATFSGAGTVDFMATAPQSAAVLTNVDGHDAVLTNQGQLKLSGQNGYFVSKTALYGAGTLSVVNSGSVEVVGSIMLNLGISTQKFVNTGTLKTTAGGALTIANTSINNAGGVVSAIGASHVDLSTNTIIFGGTLSSAGSGYIDVIDATVTLSGSNANATISSGLIKIENGASLAIAGPFTNSGIISIGGTNGGTLYAGASFTGVGEISLNNAGSQITGGFTNTGNKIHGQGTISASIDQESGMIDADVVGQALYINNAQAVVNKSTLSAEGGSLIVSSAVTGSGSATVSGGGLLRFDAAFNQNVQFQGAKAGTLMLAQSYSGTISGFGGGDVVDVAGTAYAAGEHMVLQSSANGVKTFALVDSGNQTKTTLNFTGKVLASDFVVSNDGANHAQIGYSSHAAGGADFNGDRASDVLFQSPSGALATWQLNDRAITGGGALGNPGPSWTYEGTGDFNGDRKSDILFQNSSGLLALWNMDGTTIIGAGNIGNPGKSFSVVATGDFNGDGVSDVLFRDTNNNYAMWELNGTAIIAGGSVGSPGAGWSYKAVGDFNGDGKSDILFENAQGVYALWMLNGTTITSGATLGNPGADYVFRGVGDFNGDGTSDVLFENVKTGVYATWDVTSGAVTGGGNIATPGAAYAFKAMGDYNADGKSDVLFQNVVTGAYVTWDLNDTAIIGGGAIGNPGPSYSVAKAAPASAVELPATIVFQNADGGVASWRIANTTITSGAAYGSPGGGWAAIGVGDFNGDGQIDVLFRKAGVLATWQTDGAGHVTGGGTLGNPGGTYTFKAIGDFNGDGLSDILFEDSTGNYSTWDIRGSSIIGGGAIGNPGGSFVFRAVGDFNGDGTSDILFQDASGNYAIQEIGQNKNVGGGVVGNPGADWTFRGTGDLNGDGKSDLLFQNKSGDYASWDLSGASIVGGGKIGNPGSGFTFQAIADLSGDHRSSILFKSTTDNTLATWRLNDTSIIGGGTIGNPGNSWSTVGAV